MIYQKTIQVVFPRKYTCFVKYNKTIRPQLNKDEFNVMWCILVLVPKLLLSDFVTFCSLNPSSFKFFQVYFFPVYGTSLTAAALRCVRALPYKNEHLALNRFVWWCAGRTGSRIIPYTSNGISGSYSKSLRCFGQAGAEQMLKFGCPNH